MKDIEAACMHAIWNGAKIYVASDVPFFATKHGSHDGLSYAIVGAIRRVTRAPIDHHRQAIAPCALLRREESWPAGSRDRRCGGRPDSGDRHGAPGRRHAFGVTTERSRRSKTGCASPLPGALIASSATFATCLVTWYDGTDRRSPEAENGPEGGTRVVPVSIVAIPGPPRDETVRSHEHATGRLEPEGCVELAGRVLQPFLPQPQGDELRPEFPRGAYRAFVPRRTIGRGEKSEAATEQVERRDLPAILPQPVVRRTCAGHGVGFAGIECGAGIDRRIRDHRCRSVDVTELDVHVGDEWLHRSRGIDGSVRSTYRVYACSTVNSPIGRRSSS